MKTSVPHHLVGQDYRGAIALNNIGVQLLERGCYRQGLDTLQDSIHVMKERFRPAVDKSSMAQPAAEAQNFLQRAARRLAEPQPMASASFGVPHSVETISFDMGLTPVLNFLQETPSTTCFLPVRIDIPEDFSSLVCGGDNVLYSSSPSASMGIQHRDPDIESSIILYNFGVANLLLSKVNPSHPSSTKLRSNALSIFQLASGVLSKRSGMCEDGVEEASLLQIGLLVFHCIIQVLVESGNDEEARIVCDRYYRIRDAVTSLQANEWYGGAIRISAAAA